MIVSYLGTPYRGWQLQARGATVQGELERVLTHLSGESAFRIKAAGRTDAGVHATGQVIAFTWPGGMDATELGQAIGSLLPPDVAIGPLVRVALDAARKAADISRTYYAGNFTVMSSLAAITAQMAAGLRRIENRDPDLAAYLRAIDQKIEVIGRAFITSEPDLVSQVAKPVNLSAGGMCAGVDEHYDAGTELEIRLLAVGLLSQLRLQLVDDQDLSLMVIPSPTPRGGLRVDVT